MFWRVAPHAILQAELTLPCHEKDLTFEETE